MRYTPENTVKVGKPADVFVDGVAVTHVYEADDVLGYAVVADLKLGRLQSDGVGGVARKRLEGAVRVELRGQVGDPPGSMVRPTAFRYEAGR